MVRRIPGAGGPFRPKSAPKNASITQPRFFMVLGSTLAHFWLPLAPFWLTFGVPWLTFGALSFTFAHPGIHFLTFAVSCPHFSYLFEFSMKISCKIWFLNNFLWKSHSRSIKSYFPEAHRTHPNRKYIFSCNPPFKGPERNICRRQLRSAPGPKAPEACLDLVWVPFQELI